MLLDISLPVAPGLPVWPGDQEYRLEWTLQRRRGDSVNVGALHHSVHTGTHADAPLHFGEGADAGSLPLEMFVGPALVLDARSHFVDGEVAASVLDGVDFDGHRILLRTREAPDLHRFDRDLVPPGLELARRLVEEGAPLLGTDAASMDRFDSRDLPVHHALGEGGVMILENLDLSHATPGAYELIALPLRLMGADGSPVRAVLRR